MNDKLQKEWATFSAAWPRRLIENTDRAFIEYYCGRCSRDEFENVRHHADEACRREITPVRPGHIPRWFKKRLKRALGRGDFEHLKLASSWLENCGSTLVQCPVTLIGGLGHSFVAQQDTQVFVVEPPRPWVLGGKDLPFTAENWLLGRRQWHRMLDQLLAQPNAIAESIGCYLALSRAAFTGWQNIRIAFYPEHVQDEDWVFPVSYDLRTCNCRTCSRSPAKKRRKCFNKQ